MAAMSGAWLCRKVRYPWLGGARRLTMYLATLDCATSTLTFLGRPDAVSSAHPTPPGFVDGLLAAPTPIFRRGRGERLGVLGVTYPLDLAIDRHGGAARVGARSRLPAARPPRPRCRSHAEGPSFPAPRAENPRRCRRCPPCAGGWRGDGAVRATLGRRHATGRQLCLFRPARPLPPRLPECCGRSGRGRGGLSGASAGRGRTRCRRHCPAARPPPFSAAYRAGRGLALSGLAAAWPSGERGRARQPARSRRRTPCAADRRRDRRSLGNRLAPAWHPPAGRLPHPLRRGGPRPRRDRVRRRRAAGPHLSPVVAGRRQDRGPRAGGGTTGDRGRDCLAARLTALACCRRLHLDRRDTTWRADAVNAPSHG